MTTPPAAPAAPGPPDAPRPGPATGAGPPGAFLVELRRSGQTLPVHPEETLISVVRRVVPVDSTCLVGDCGSCVSTVLEGVVDHRCTVLSERARLAGRRIALCVDRSATALLVLDL